MERLIKFVEFIGACPLGGSNFPGRYEYYLKHGELPQDCSNRSVKKKK
jgi:hypothetical protein